MADILKIALIVVGILAIYVNYWLLAQALFPSLVERAAKQYASPVKLTVIGLAAALAPVILGLILAQRPNPVFQISGITMMVVPGLLGLAGSAGLTSRIGAGLNSPLDASQPWRRVLRGGIVLSGSFLLPVVGWIIIPIWVLISGLGAFLLSLKAESSDSPTPFIPATQPIA